MEMSRYVLIIGHQGLGDHLICNSIYRDYAGKFDHVFIPVVKNYLSTIRQMLGDESNITLIPLYSNYVYRQQKILRNLFKLFGISSLDLGRLNSNYFRLNGMKIDEIFYFQAKVSIEDRWSEFAFKENRLRQNMLHDRLIGDIKKPYIFLHEDKPRGFIIDQDYLNDGSLVVRPDISLNFTIFDYKSLIEGAAEIHCIESSFCLFIDSLKDSKQRLFVHRYARPEAKNNYRNQINYKRKWHIMNG